MEWYRKRCPIGVADSRIKRQLSESPGPGLMLSSKATGAGSKGRAGLQVRKRGAVQNTSWKEGGRRGRGWKHLVPGRRNAGPVWVGVLDELLQLEARERVVEGGHERSELKKP